MGPSLSRKAGEGFCFETRLGVQRNEMGFRGPGGRVIRPKMIVHMVTRSA